jgi:hypothetical protein
VPVLAPLVFVDFQGVDFSDAGGKAGATENFCPPGGKIAVAGPIA